MASPRDRLAGQRIKLPALYQVAAHKITVRFSSTSKIIIIIIPSAGKIKIKSQVVKQGSPWQWPGQKIGHNCLTGGH